MAQLAELLERFRHPGTPGPPTPASGVPADAAADLQAELRPLIAALDEIEAETRRLVEAARVEAAAIRDRGAGDAQRIRAEAIAQAARMRAAQPEGEAPDDPGGAEAAAVLDGARAEAAAIRERAEARIPALVARVVDGILAGLAAGHTEEAGDVARVGRR